MERESVKMSKMAPIGIFLNLLALLGFWNNYDFPGFLIALTVIWGLSVVGLFLVLMGIKKIGAWMIIVPSILFAPLGLIAAIGGVKILKAIEQKTLDS